MAMVNANRNSLRESFLRPIDNLFKFVHAMGSVSLLTAAFRRSATWMSSDLRSQQSKSIPTV